MTCSRNYDLTPLDSPVSPYLEDLIRARARGADSHLDLDVPTVFDWIFDRAMGRGTDSDTIPGLHVNIDKPVPDPEKERMQYLLSTREDQDREMTSSPHSFDSSDYSSDSEAGGPSLWTLSLSFPLPPPNHHKAAYTPSLSPTSSRSFSPSLPSSSLPSPQFTPRWSTPAEPYNESKAIPTSAPCLVSPYECDRTALRSVQSNTYTTPSSLSPGRPATPSSLTPGGKLAPRPLSALSHLGQATFLQNPSQIWSNSLESDLTFTTILPRRLSHHDLPPIRASSAVVHSRTPQTSSLVTRILPSLERPRALRVGARIVSHPVESYPVSGKGYTGHSRSGSLFANTNSR